ncbi:alpha/beta hydrolase [Microbispora sp. ZYX-F-249]|uniref:Alpha/beta hydrolase n=1 Tax=Microbispora maris TaxID=3144104 RepID=A0ABV0AN54_9ACTN
MRSGAPVIPSSCCTPASPTRACGIPSGSRWGRGSTWSGPTSGATGGRRTPRRGRTRTRATSRTCSLRSGCAGVALVGSSYGGRVALELATGHPDLVARLVLLNAGCGLPPTPDLEAFGSEEDRLIEAGDVGGAVDLNVRTWLGPEADQAVGMRLAAMQRHAFEVQLAADPEPERGRDPIDLPAVTAPALVVVGGHDLPYFRGSGRHIAETMPHATLLDLDWAGHLPSLERPAEITSLLCDFLS